MENENLIIIKVAGGIGNQLFQIANAYQLSIKYNRKLLICNSNSSSRNCYWDSILCKFKDYLIDNNTFNNYKQKSQIYNWAMTRFEYKEIILDPNITIYCIEGYYQTYKYFDISTFKTMLHLDFKQTKYNITENDICIHIRRTDYLNNNFHKPLNLNYYYNSLSRLNTIYSNIYVFSDDLEWSENFFHYRNTIFVQLDNEIQELVFMSQFQHIIMANSSFSWWATLLGQPISVFCPKNWFVPNCHLNTKDLRLPQWTIIDDDLDYDISLLPSKKFNRNVFNVISFGSTCCMVQNIHDNIYKDLGPLYRQPDNATNFFDWVICDFKSILFVFENLQFRDYTFLNNENISFNDNKATSQQLAGGWNQAYRKAEHKSLTMIFLHDIRKNATTISQDFFDKYIRRFERLYFKLLDNESIHFTHCFDFQWLQPYFPNNNEIQLFFDYCKFINPYIKVHLYFLIHPKYKTPQNKSLFESYTSFNNVEIFYLQDKGFHSDWKANNLTFDKFFM